METIISERKHFSLWKPVSKSLPRNWGEFEKGLRFLATRAVADSGSTSPIVPQELSPDVIPIYVSKFPLFDMLEKVPSNGLSHTYQREIAFSQNDEPSTLIAETGNVNDDTNKYDRQNSNIAVFGTRRGVTVKAQAAGNNSGGPASDLMGRELRGGLLKIAKDAQTVSCRYQTADSGETDVTSADGAYSGLGFNGLRYVLNNLSPAANTIKVDITAPWTDQRVLRAVRQGCNQIWDTGGEIDLLIAQTTGSEAMFEDQMDLVRYFKNDLVEVTPGLTVRAISTDQGLIPVLVVPGKALGTWASGGHTYCDIIGINTETVVLPYLGNPTPSVLRIPIGVDGSLRELAIPFAMFGMACEAPEYMFRVSLQTA